MKVAILSDIHGNADALKAVLKSAPADISEFWILGDMVGYYYKIKEVLQLLRNRPCKFIAGNHEHYLKDGLKNPAILKEYKIKYGSAIDIAIETLSAKDVSFLTKLPDSLEFIAGSFKILLCHGSPWDFDEYIYPDSPQNKIDAYAAIHVDFIFQGHTHYPMELKQNNKKIINPGSVGQPRNRNPSAQWAIFDTSSGEVTFKATEYSIDSLLNEIDKYDPENSYLKTVLTRR